MGIYDKERWGVASGGPDKVRVTRYADRDAAEKVADKLPKLRVQFEHPKTRKLEYGTVDPLVYSGDGCRTWVFSATGWTAPTK